MSMKLLKEFLSRFAGERSALWHKCRPVLPVKLTDGSRSDLVGQIWRRWTPNGWEYKQDLETEDQFDERNW